MKCVSAKLEGFAKRTRSKLEFVFLSYIFVDCYWILLEIKLIKVNKYGKCSSNDSPESVRVQQHSEVSTWLLS